MDDAQTSQPSGNVNIAQGGGVPDRPKKLKFSNRSWLSPQLFGFVLVFVVIGAYFIFRSFAATVAETKVWSTTADWNTGTLSSSVVTGNTVTLAKSSVSSSAGPVSSTSSTSPDLALNKPVVASSTQNTTYNGTTYYEPASNAVDGNTSTRWSSNYSDPQWIYVDLGATYNISEVKLNWETAYGKAYQIQVSNDATNWTTIYSTTTGTGGINDLTGLSGSGRYVRMYGTVRGTVNGNQWGYSLWEMSVYGTLASNPTANLALNKPVVASSTQNTTYNGTTYYEPASNAVDGNTSTRWSSNYSDPQWIYVDLGATYNISEVKLNWETAYGKAYQIQVSNDATNWTTIYSTTTGTGGINDLTGLSGSGRYVRMYGTVRGTVNGNQWGYSLWEMSVYGTPTSGVPTPVGTSYMPSGNITLSYDAGSSVAWTSLTPVTTTPSGTSVTYQARTSSDNSTWSAWTSSSNISTLANSRYIQIQADLSTTGSGSTPVLSSLTLGYNTTVASPTATLSASPTTITSGQNATLTWSSANTTSCTASGAWSGAEATAGSTTVTPTVTSTYNLSCSGPGGSVTATPVTVTVNPVVSSGGIAPSNVPMPTVPSGWHTVFSSTFNTPESFGSVGESGPPGWYGPYSGGTGDTAQRRGQGSGEWVNNETVTVGPNNSGDGAAVPANVLDIWQHTQNGIPVSAVLIPDCTGTATNGCSTTPYNQDQGLTSECVSFEYRVVNPVRGYKMVPLLWNDPNLSYAEVDSPENDFGNNTITMAMYFPTYPSNDSSYIDPNFSIANGVYSYNLNWGANTPSNINLNNWTEWETCRTPGELKLYIDGVLAFDGKDGQTFTQWGSQPGVIQVPQSSMHWVLQTETSTNVGEQPTSSVADHVQFNWVQITAPN